MEKKIYDTYVSILKKELIVAMGCTEPIAIAYAGAKARDVLGKMPERVTVCCSGNIIKNVKGVTVPHSGGRRGIDIAAVLGIVGGDAARELDVLKSVTPEQAETAARLVSEGICKCSLAENVENLHIDLQVFAGGESARILIQDHHTNITLVEKNGVPLYKGECGGKKEEEAPDLSVLNVKDILAFGDCVEIADISECIDRQISCNAEIAQEGLAKDWGACVGRTLMASGNPSDLKTLTVAASAAGSDARMAGCPLPVVINSGSGNQGITITLPILTYAKAYKVPLDRVRRALCVANLLGVHQKKYIGSLSAYCGAVSAACASVCGVAYMLGDGCEVIGRVITNTLCTIGGVVCDGAKSSCAAKIAASVQAALNAWEMARRDKTFQPGEGLTGQDVETTIAMVGQMGKVGMHGTDVEILELMLQNKEA